jgi:hypothetical protein
LIDQITHLTPWSGVLLEKLIVTQLFKKLLVPVMEPEGYHIHKGSYPEADEFSYSYCGCVLFLSPSRQMLG